MEVQYRAVFYSVSSPPPGGKGTLLRLKSNESKAPSSHIS